MKKRDVLAVLETAAADSGIRIIYDEIDVKGGLCRVQDRRLLIVNSRFALEQKIAFLVDELTKAGLDLPPEIARYGSAQT